MPAAPKVFGIILAGGEGKRLMPLTEDRAKPAVPFGGQYRLIDFAISNLINSGLRQIVVLTQYKSHSLDRHISQTWRMSALLNSYVASVPAQQRLGKRWFSGSADAILQSLNLRPRKLDIVSCPSCGRAQVDVYTLAEQVTKGLEGMEAPLRVAVMGCVVNGPGEAREADLGVASGNGKGQIFVKGEVIKTVPEDEIVETLLTEARRIAAEMGEVGQPEVSVS